MFDMLKNNVKVGDKLVNLAGDVCTVILVNHEVEKPYLIDAGFYKSAGKNFHYPVEVNGRYNSKRPAEGIESFLDIVGFADLENKPEKKMLLPTDAKERKQIPITTGVLDYFPLAIAEVAKLSKAGNDQHNPGEDLHWDRSKSKDHADCISRHLIDRGKLDTDNQRHSAKLAWRALALLQIELENEQKKGKSE